MNTVAIQGHNEAQRMQCLKRHQDAQSALSQRRKPASSKMPRGGPPFRLRPYSACATPGRHRGCLPPNGASSVASAHGATRASKRKGPVPCRTRQELIGPHPAGAVKDCPRHPARPAGESAGGQGKRRKGRASPTAKVPSTRGRPGAHSGRHRTRGSSSGAPAEDRPCKRRRFDVAPQFVPDARLSGRGWHERWPPPAEGSGGLAPFCGR